MITLREVSFGIYGAWRLAHGDRGGLSFFESSERGFWRSFWAAAFVAPAYALLVGFEFADRAPNASVLTLLTVQAIAYVMDWTAFPLAMIYGTRMLDREHHFFRFIVAFNWGRAVEAAVLVPTALVAVMWPNGPLAALPFFAFFAILLYHWWIAKSALDVNGGEAVMVLVIKLAIGVIIMLWSHSIIF